MDYQKPDRRYIPRWETQNRVVYSMGDLCQNQDGFTKDLNGTGTCIWVDRHPGIDRKIQVTIYLNDHTVVDMQGKFVWTRPQLKGFYVGIRFLNPTLEAQDLILEHAFRVDRERFLEQLFRGWKNHPY